MSLPAIPLRPRALDHMDDPPIWWRRIDVLLIASVVVVAVIGMIMIYSATRSSRGPVGYSGFVVRQGVWVSLGLIAMTIIASVDYRRWRPLLVWAYGGVLVLLIGVLTPLGAESKGAQAWFPLGGFQLQPSEFAKPVIIGALAAFCAMRQRLFAYRHVAVAVGIAGAPMLLILLQPDFGTMLVFAAILVSILVVSGAPARAIVALVAVAVVGFILAAQLGILKQYQLDRLGAFLDPESNVERSAYNLSQSKIAIGSGGVMGKGLFQGTQTSLRYVPEQHTDFIFTVVGEELGLIGGATVLVLLAVVIWRVLAAARRSANTFGMLMCVGVAGMLVFQVFQNIGMTMGIMPITGIPLPFLSYGGSTTLVQFMGIGLVLSVSLHPEQ